jgi:hypothetical protein
MGRLDASEVVGLGLDHVAECIVAKGSNVVRITLAVSESNPVYARIKRGKSQALAKIFPICIELSDLAQHAQP